MSTAPGTSGSAAAGARALIEAYERSLPAATRHGSGVHYTPGPLARFLVARGIDALGELPRTVCDPTCGGGSFLLAAAEELAAHGLDPVEVVEQRLVGAELDPEAARVARAALVRWAEDRVATSAAHGERAGVRRGSAGIRPRIEVADTLLRQPSEWPERPPTGFDLVVGNPPFLNQLGSDTARGQAQRAGARQRFAAVGGYTDSASVFLLGALELVRPGGVVAMVQPQSFLAARDTAAVRAEVVAQARVHDVWSSDEELFDAAVRVCAPVVRRRRSDRGDSPSGSARTHGPVRVWWGRPDDALARFDAPVVPVDGGSWGPLFAAAIGLPAVAPHGGARLASIASATAGFRDEFYALRDAASDDPADHGTTPVAAVPIDDERPRLVTVGMIDPCGSSWGGRARRFGGRLQRAPRLDPEALAVAAPRVAAWVAARRVPKVLVATQTRVVEAVVDPTGTWIPVTPTISVEPLVAGEQLWSMLAALSAPPVSALALATHLGAGLSPGALRWSASSVLQVELPLDDTTWARGAGLAERLCGAAAADRPDLLRALGSTMCEAYGLAADDPVLDWWFERAVRSGR